MHEDQLQRQSLHSSQIGGMINIYISIGSNILNDQHSTLCRNSNNQPQVPFVDVSAQISDNIEGTYDILWYLLMFNSF